MPGAVLGRREATSSRVSSWETAINNHSLLFSNNSPTPAYSSVVPVTLPHHAFLPGAGPGEEAQAAHVQEWDLREESFSSKRVKFICRILLNLKSYLLMECSRRTHHVWVLSVETGLQETVEVALQALPLLLPQLLSGQHGVRGPGQSLQALRDGGDRVELPPDVILGWSIETVSVWQAIAITNKVIPPRDMLRLVCSRMKWWNLFSRLQCHEPCCTLT